MAIKTATQAYPIYGNTNFLQVLWTGLANGDEGDPFILTHYADRSVQISGTFGVGGVVAIQGTNDGVTYNTLTDNQGNPLSFTSGKLVEIMELTLMIKPIILSGDGTTNINISMMVKK